jgi:hypothetical protein
MSYALIGLCVMSIVLVLFAALSVLVRNKHVRHFLATSVQHTLAHPAGAGYSPSIEFSPEVKGEGWALIDRALRARSAVRFDVR